MQIIIKEGDLTVTREITPIAGKVSAESAMIAAYDIISRIFSQAAVIRAYHATDPDIMGLRDD
jgi:hypothetical protein